MSYMVNGVNADEFFQDHGVPDIEITGTEDSEIIHNLTKMAFYAAGNMYNGGKHTRSVSFEDDRNIAKFVFSGDPFEGRCTYANLYMNSGKFTVVSTDGVAKAEINSELPDSVESRYLMNEARDLRERDNKAFRSGTWSFFAI